MPRPSVTPVDLAGAWTFDRGIDDRYAGEHLTVEGTMRLSVEPDGRVRWAENGVLTRGDFTTPVTRVLFVEPRGDGWFVTFDDGREFHPWAPGADVDHPCGADHYRGRVDVADPASAWAVEWVVVGPAKDYTMTTLLRRHGSR